MGGYPARVEAWDSNLIWIFIFLPADQNWYRAVVLEAGENEMSILYADYGNSEIVPFSRILPIPAHLMKLPFQIIRCTLTGIAVMVLMIT